MAVCLAEARAFAGSPAAPLLRLGVRDVLGESGLAGGLLAKHGPQAEGIRGSVRSSGSSR